MNLADLEDQYDREQAWNKRLERIPLKWRGPIVDVVDTFAEVKFGLEAIGITDPAALSEAVWMVMGRYDLQSAAENAK